MSPENLFTTLRWLLSENLLLQRLFFASLELAALALVVVLLVRLGRIRSPRLASLLWLVVLIKPIVSLAFGSPVAVGLLDPATPQPVEVAQSPAWMVDPTADAPQYGWASVPWGALAEQVPPETPTRPAPAPLPRGATSGCSSFFRKGRVGLGLRRSIGHVPIPSSVSRSGISSPGPAAGSTTGRTGIRRGSQDFLPASIGSRPCWITISNVRIPTSELGTIHYDLARTYSRGPLKPEAGEVEFIWVLLSGQCKWGHHCYANSATNGPRGDALVYELIPHIDRKFRTVPAPTARFLTGHSSGGWSSLWLQVSYPQFFGGVWSNAPDAVDFRSFPQINLYADPPMNFYYDRKGRRRPIARRGTRPWLWAESFCRMDDCLGRGGLLRSFEAVFSPCGSDGLPRRLWDRKTGRINPEVARAWQKYDLRMLLEENWDALGPKLEGKLHIVVGELDTFYLEGAVKRLAETLGKLGSNAQIEIIPGKDHFNLATSDCRRRFRRQMSQTYLKHYIEDPTTVSGR